MPAIPPSNEPSLPQLRRFRFSPDNPNVAHEVDAEGNPIAPAPRPAKPVDPRAEGEPLGTRQQPDTQPPVASPSLPDRTPSAERFEAAERPSTVDRPSVSGRAPSAERSAAEEDLREVDEMLAELAPKTGPSRVAPADPRSSGPTRLSAAEPSRTPKTGPPHTPATGPTRTPTTGPPRTSATESTHLTSPEPVQRRSPWPFALTGLAAALVVGLVAWLVLAPGGDDGNGRGTEQAAPGGSAEVSEWAAGICQALTEFQTAAMPLRAEAAKAKAADSGEAAVTDLQRETSALLTTLATDLQSTGLPAGSEAAAAAHKTMVSATNAAATSAKGGGGSSVGATDDALAALLGALDRPVTIFQEVVADLSGNEHAAVTAEPSCDPLL